MVSSDGEGDLPARVFPDLNKRVGMAQKSLARDCQSSSCLVAHEYSLPQLFLQRADARTHSGLGDVQSIRRTLEAAGSNHG